MPEIRAAVSARCRPGAFAYTPRMDFELTAEQQALRARAHDLADSVFAERAARWDEREE